MLFEMIVASPSTGLYQVVFMIQECQVVKSYRLCVAMQFMNKITRLAAKLQPKTTKPLYLDPDQLFRSPSGCLQQCLVVKQACMQDFLHMSYMDAEHIVCSLNH